MLLVIDFAAGVLLGLLAYRGLDWYSKDRIMWLDGADLRSLPLNIHRHKGILYAAHVRRCGLGLFEAVCQKDCEGIVAKHRDAPYVSRSSLIFVL
jgi:hypothetical protein